MDEKELVKRLKKGESQYFSEVVNKYKKVVYNHSVSFLRNYQDAEDATQEIFVNVYKNIDKFRGDSKLGTWIYRITVNVCKNKLKQLQRLRKPIIDEHYEQGGDDNEKGSLLDYLREKAELEPDNVVASAELQAVVFKRINELTEEQKQVIILRDVDGFPYDEISDILKLSVSAVKSKLFRARENLRETLEKDGIL